MRNLFRRSCERCKKFFNTYETDKFFCTDLCRSKKIYCEIRGIEDTKLKKQIHDCIICERETTNKKYCSKRCQQIVKNKKQKEKNALKEKKPRKKVSFAWLNKMEEWKRLNDDNRWLDRFNGRRM